MPNTAQYIMPFMIKKRAIYTEILTEEANPKSIFELPANNVARTEYENACHYIMKRTMAHGEKEKFFN